MEWMHQIPPDTYKLLELKLTKLNEQ
jgi:hypothetical protein